MFQKRHTLLSHLLSIPSAGEWQSMATNIKSVWFYRANSSGNSLQPLHLLKWDLATTTGQSVEQEQSWEGGTWVECASQAPVASRGYTSDYKGGTYSRGFSTSFQYSFSTLFSQVSPIIKNQMHSNLSHCICFWYPGLNKWVPLSSSPLLQQACKKLLK